MVTLIVTGTAPVKVSAQQPATMVAPPVFDGVTVVDVAQGTLVPNRRAVIRGNRIRVVGAAGAVALPQGAQIVDARGKYLIPGLWDMHVHPMHDTDIFYPLFLANGITGVRDPGTPWPLDTLARWKREIAAGTRLGPRFVTSTAQSGADHVSAYPRLRLSGI